MRHKQLKDIGEFGLIAELKKKFPFSSDVVRSIGDDTAVLKKDRNTYSLFTTDMMVEGVHFKSDDFPRDVGYKAMAVNVSDIAAMGGVPKWAVISLGISPKRSLEDVRELYRGIRKCAVLFGVQVVGGDTVKSSKIVISVSLIGEVKKKEVVFRDGARPGDRIFVTGSLGGSLKSQKHLRFVPRVEEGRLLATKFKPTAMIDISDGLVADLGHILQESGVGADIFKDDIPANKDVSFKQALYDGEDFELLFTLPEKKTKGLGMSKSVQHQFYEIGRIVDQRQGLSLIDGKGKRQPLVVKGYTHF